MKLRNYSIIAKAVPTFYFIGVTTQKSSIMKVFPLWMRELGHPEIAIEGVDLKIHDRPEAYRAAVAQIKEDPCSLGGLVTTHKIDTYAAAQDMFDDLDPYARICGEISCISKREGRLEGHAKDPITAGLALDAITSPGYFGRTGGQVLCFGAGGSAAAALLHLMNQQNAGDRPKKFTAVNRSPKRLVQVRNMVREHSADIEVRLIHTGDPHVNDRIMGELPEYSLVINATGMGKDTPGSPLTTEGQFPRHGIAWDFNYRGALDFKQQAMAQKDSRDLRVEDGWLYFLHGWTQVVAQVLHIDMEDALFNRLKALAESVR